MGKLRTDNDDLIVESNRLKIRLAAAISDAEYILHHKESEIDRKQMMIELNQEKHRKLTEELEAHEELIQELKTEILQSQKALQEADNMIEEKAQLDRKMREFQAVLDRQEGLQSHMKGRLSCGCLAIGGRAAPQDSPPPLPPRPQAAGQDGGEAEAHRRPQAQAGARQGHHGGPRGAGGVPRRDQDSVRGAVARGLPEVSGRGVGRPDFGKREGRVARGVRRGGCRRSCCVTAPSVVPAAERPAGERVRGDWGPVHAPAGRQARAAWQGHAGGQLDVRSPPVGEPRGGAPGAGHAVCHMAVRDGRVPHQGVLADVRLRVRGGRA